LSASAAKGISSKIMARGEILFMVGFVPGGGIRRFGDLYCRRPLSLADVTSVAASIAVYQSVSWCAKSLAATTLCA
jgi:hypothetical protein